ncbi:MAG: hypothetical protein J0H64_05135 [Actinobacteria bacterium]|nr:hypothetical protein [Actinomycetota bacterium]
MGSLRVAGFQGFLPVHQLAGSPTLIPNERGVYVWVRDSRAEPEFLEVDTGGHFKGRNPNVPIDELRSNWVAGSAVVYIGKAGDPDSSSTLRQRLGQYLKFGAGAAVGHWGGRYVWQLADSSDLLIAWLPLPDGFPSAVESELIDQFRAQFGERPFANLAK